MVNPPPLRVASGFGVPLPFRRQLAFGWVPIFWGECDAPELRGGGGEFDADFAGIRLFAYEDNASLHLLLRGGIDDQQFLHLDYAGFQMHQAPVGTDRYRFG